MIFTVDNAEDLQDVESESIAAWIDQYGRYREGIVFRDKSSGRWRYESAGMPSAPLEYKRRLTVYPLTVAPDWPAGYMVFELTNGVVIHMTRELEHQTMVSGVTLNGMRLSIPLSAIRMACRR